MIVPTKNITLNSWTGTGFTVIHGDGTYEFRLSNGTNGGATTNVIDEWASRGEDLFELTYLLSFVLSLGSYITAGVALFGPFCIASMAAFTSIGPLIVAFLAFAWSCYSLYTSGSDLVAYYNGEKTSLDKFQTYGKSTIDLLILIIFGKMVFGK